MAWKSPYGIEFASEIDPLTLELMLYKDHAWLVKNRGLETEWTGHFRRVVEIIWGKNNRAKCWEWNPWAERCLKACHYHPITGNPYPHTGVSGCGSSGKTGYLALHMLVNWLCDPVNTLCMVTSTDLAAARKRVWGEITEFWLAAQNIMPGKLVESKGIIVTIDSRTGQKLPDKSGISLIAAEKRKEKDAIGKIIGAKNKRVFMGADELPELTEAILEASLSNLATNPMCQVIAAGNFKNRYDAFGQFVEPADGYDSITVDSDAWITKYGHCIRLDGLKSPNILSGENKWKGIYGSKQLAAHRRDLGENTAGFWRMCRSFEAPIGNDNVIFSESDFTAGKARELVIWNGQTVKVSGMDPSFTNGGDRTVQWIGRFGQDTTGKNVLCIDKKYLIREDVRKTDRPRNFQVADQFKENCIAEGVLPKYAAVDSTAAGGVLCDIISELWSNEILRVDFSGAASDRQVTAMSPKTGRESYDRRVSELWYVGLEFLKYGQLKGLTEELIREMKARHYETVKSADGLKMKVEIKPDMKERLGFSPDYADAYWIMLDLCRQRLNFLAGGTGSGMMQSSKKWEDEVKTANAVYDNIGYEQELDVAV